MTDVMDPLRSHHLAAILPVAAAVYGWTETDFLAALKQAVQAVGLHLVSETAYTFQPQGISAVVLLAESHVALHFWPELGKVTVDIHVCDFHQDNLTKAKQLAEILSELMSDRGQSSDWHTLSIAD
jgi:S-adenosylmethionine decarboxylase